MMAISGSLQVYHDVGIGKNRLYANRFKGAVRRDHSSLLYVHLSSHVARLDTSSLCLSDRVHRPLSFVASRCNKLICRACLIPSQANTTPILKPATIAAVRLYDTLRGNPLFVQLVPAVGIIAFAVWGMGPLLHLSRNLLLQRSDSNWKKSTTHHVMSSYLQPLLLWTGAILVCRAVDPIILSSEASQVVKQRLLTFVRSLSTVLAFAYCLSSLIQSAQKFFMETNDSNDTRNMGFQFAGKAVYTAVWVAAVSLFMELLGFSTQKWLTAGGLGTVLLTLAGREIFTNFLSSAMIHATRPFIVNEWIQTKIEGYEVSGTVEHVGWWSPTIIRGEDREAVHIPNHKFTVNVVRNLTQKTHWRIKTHLAISHLDVNKINNIVSDMRKVLAKNPSVEQQKLHRRVFLDNINPENQALLILISCFVKTSHFEEYLCVKEALLLDLLRVISHHRARLATPIRTVQKVYSDADMDGIAFSETMYSPPREAINRPFLLIEPSYRVNGDDKSKVQARSTRKNEDQDTKVKPDIKVTETPLETKTESKVTGTSPDLKSDHKNVATSTSDSKVNVKATAASSETTKADAKDTVKSTSNLKTPSPVSDIKQSKKTEAGVAHSSKTNIPTKTSVSSTTPGVKTGISAAKSHTKQENDKLPGTSPSPSRPSLEDNIVLGVALEGSKRTLPIEDGMTPPTLQEETKELAATRPAHSGNGSSSGGRKDKKDGNQGPSTAPGVPAGDQREQER